MFSLSGMAVKEEDNQWLIHLPVGKSFELEKAVCSHGLFMMAPNLWIPSSKTLQRPLRLADSTTSVTVRISQRPPLSSFLHLRIFGPHSLTFQDELAIKTQVTRMLRISDENDQKISEFHKTHPLAKERGFGRVFRSPTLFEDMVKCILFCNCQWPRTLSMARALCELQLELKGDPLGCLAVEAAFQDEVRLKAEDFLPKTPVRKEGKRRRLQHKKIVTNLASKFVKNEDNLAIGVGSTIECDDIPKLPIEENSCNNKNFRRSAENITEVCSISDSHPGGSSYRTGDFPRPEELAVLSEGYLTKRCNLGYRGERILNLARSIVENRFQLRELEENCDRADPSNYDELTQNLLDVKGFGPFSCANILMCMGFYHKIPTDSETVRHLKQFHGRICNIKTVQKDVEEIYGKYTPFQFLAYWSEIWNGYEERFGKLSDMPHSDYNLITASNMRKRISKVCAI